jgi:hypothetical protein
MASQILADLVQQVTETRGVLQSTRVFVEGVDERITAAVNQALANGATAEELAPITELQAALRQDTNDLALAVQAQG